MTTICAWCQRLLPPAPPSADGQSPAGLCPDCARRLHDEQPVALADLVNEFRVPVLAVDDDVVVLAVNEAARVNFNLTTVATTGRRYGDIIECVHAREPGGCGRTVHCPGCTMRRTVVDTAADGNPRHHVLALQSIRTPHGVKLISYRISTQAVGKTVLVTIGPERVRPRRRRPAENATAGDRPAAGYAESVETP
ncbi:MAG TPA: hypothetical protein VLW52_14410 [Opitutaceae bacterium]|nr:hypothetical protein [Opitutaceae bacterium]